LTPLYGNALKRIRSGVLVPLLLPLLLAALLDDADFGCSSVVCRPFRFVVSEEGGGGRWERSGFEFENEIEGRMEQRQRKHSPVP
jgi:hypothetical protein